MLSEFFEISLQIVDIDVQGVFVLMPFVFAQNSSIYIEVCFMKSKEIFELIQKVS